MKVVLVHMPWAFAHTPSLALGILRTAAERHGHEVTVRYANLDFADWLAEHTDFSSIDDQFFTDASYFLGAGDWVFAEALDGGEDPAAREADFERVLAAGGVEEERIALTRRLRALAPAFLDELVDSLVALGPDVVGFTTTFQQNVASLAAAKRLKERLPSTRTVFGGANCDGVAGAALHRNFAFLDFVVRGEGELVFPGLLDRIAAGATQFADLAGLCWRAEGGGSTVNDQAEGTLPPSVLVAPTYDGWPERLAASVTASWSAPMLVAEGARGCWWGEKHHCTFCGLNGSSMAFRSKRPEVFVDEVMEMARRHRILDFIVVDNIIDMGYFDTALKSFAASGFDLRLHYEVKSNLRRHQFQVLADAGAAQVQPGIENLSSRVLKLMDKGVTGTQNVRALRDAQGVGVTISWNYLFGFPGEQAEDYAEILDQLPALYHLEPPGGATRIAIERFSPYFNQPGLGFPVLRPAPQYRALYRLPEGELADIAYLFDAPRRGLDDDAEARLRAAIRAWRLEYQDARLTLHDLGERVVLVSRRRAFDWTVLELDDAEELAAFRLLDQPRSVQVVAGVLSGGLPAAERLLARWRELGIVFHDAGRYVQVAVTPENQPLRRIRTRAYYQSPEDMGPDRLPAVPPQTPSSPEHLQAAVPAGRAGEEHHAVVAV